MIRSGCEYSFSHGYFIGLNIAETSKAWPALRVVKTRRAGHAQLRTARQCCVLCFLPILMLFFFFNISLVGKSDSNCKSVTSSNLKASFT